MSNAKGFTLNFIGAYQAQWLSTALLTICSLFVTQAQAQNFNVPDGCTDGVSGIDDVYSDLPPVATVTDNNGNELPGIVFQDTHTKNWFVQVTVTKPFATYLIVATYTPFLQSYRQEGAHNAGVYTFQLPAAGVYYNPLYKLYSKVTLTINTTLTSKTPMPGAFVELAPDFPGSSPYTAEADDEGQVVLYCFTALPLGNNVTVLSPDHDFAYTDTITFSPVDETLTHAIGSQQMPTIKKPSLFSRIKNWFKKT